MLLPLLLVALVPQSLKINAPLPRDAGVDGGAGQDVLQVELSPGGLWVAYIADQDVEGTWELYAVPVDGSASARKLSGGETFDFDTGNALEIDPADSTVVYAAMNGSVRTLYRAPIDGSAPSQALGTQVFSRSITPDGQSILFTSTMLGGPIVLFRVPLDGSAAAVPISSGGSVIDHRTTPDGQTVVYQADGQTPGKLELWRVPVTGGVPAQRISLPLAADRDVFAFDLTSDGTRAVYRANQNLVQVMELCSVPIDPGSGLSSYCSALPTFATVTDLSLSPDGTGVLFVADARFDERFELFFAPVDGSANPRLVSGTMIAQGDVRSGDFAFSADGEFALFLADRSVDEQVELYSTSLVSPGPPVRLSPDLIADGDVPELPLVVGTQVAFLADAEEDGRFALYGIPESGGTPVRLHAALGPGQSVGGDLVAGPCDTVLFRADLRLEGVTDLWGVPVDGSATPTPLTILDLTGDVRDFRFEGGGVSGDSVVFVADIDPDETQQVWRVPLDGSQAPVALNGPLMPSPIVGDVTSIGWSPDGGSALYIADQATDNRQELFAVDLEVGHGPYRLNAPSNADAVTSDDEQPALFQSDEERLVYRDRYFSVGYSGGSDAIYTTRLDGSEFPVRLDEPATSNKGNLALTDQRVVFVQYFTGFHPPPFFHVWSAPLDGSSPAVLVSLGGTEVALWPVLTPDGAFVWMWIDGELHRAPIDGSAPPQSLGYPSSELQIAPQGDRIVFLGDPYGNGVGLYVLPIDGSGVPLRIDQLPSATRSIEVFTFTPGGQRVLYVADQEASGVQELYSVPITGGPTVKLSPVPVAGGDVDSGASGPPFLLVAPDGGRVVFTGDLELDGVLELYSAPVDGSVPAVRLNDALGDTRDVVAHSARITPDSRFVLWAADQELDGRLELYLAPIDGSLPAVKLNPPLVAGGSVRSDFEGTGSALKLGPLGLRAYYLADQEVDQRVELYAVSLYGHGVQKVNDPLVAGGNVNTFQLSPEGHQVLYLADQEVDEVNEAFLVTFPTVTPVAPHPAPTRSVTATTD